LTTDLTARTSLAERGGAGEDDWRVPRQIPAGALGSSPTSPSQTHASNWQPMQQRDIALPDDRRSIDFTARPTVSGVTPLGEVPPFQPFPDALIARRVDRPTQESPSSPTRLHALQVHNRYLITESSEGVIVIDQHALHERIIYEQLREKVLSGDIESQKLLVPEPVPLSPTEFALVLQAVPTLAKLGIAVEPFGGTTMLVSAYPAMLANQNPTEMLRAIVEHLTSSQSEIEHRDVVDDLLHMISCKAAVKAGDRLTPGEIEALLEHRTLCQDAHHCPHGRPTALVFSREELDRRFKRT
jgi:DNA mismatch repair protein MutL